MPRTLTTTDAKFNIPGIIDGSFVNHKNEAKNSGTGYPGKREGS